MERSLGGTAEKPPRVAERRGLRTDLALLGLVAVIAGGVSFAKADATSDRMMGLPHYRGHVVGGRLYIDGHAAWALEIARFLRAGGGRAAWERLHAFVVRSREFPRVEGGGYSQPVTVVGPGVIAVLQLLTDDLPLAFRLGTGLASVVALVLLLRLVRSMGASVVQAILIGTLLMTHASVIHALFGRYVDAFVFAAVAWLVERIHAVLGGARLSSLLAAVAVGSLVKHSFAPFLVLVPACFGFAAARGRCTAGRALGVTLATAGVALATVSAYLWVTGFHVVLRRTFELSQANPRWYAALGLAATYQWYLPLIVADRRWFKDPFLAGVAVAVAALSALFPAIAGGVTFRHMLPMVPLVLLLVFPALRALDAFPAPRRALVLASLGLNVAALLLVH